MTRRIFTFATGLAAAAASAAASAHPGHAVPAGVPAHDHIHVGSLMVAGLPWVAALAACAVVATVLVLRRARRARRGASAAGGRGRDAARR